MVVMAVLLKPRGLFQNQPIIEAGAINRPDFTEEVLGKFLPPPDRKIHLAA
jgi:hypothetical protein